MNKSAVNGDHSLSSSSRIPQGFSAGSDVLGRLDDFIAFNDVILGSSTRKSFTMFLHSH